MSSIDIFKQYLCPPGNGVYTVHTGSDRRSSLHQSLYKTSEPKQVDLEWKKKLSSYTSQSTPCLIGATMDTGGGILRGCNWGPLYLRQFFREFQNRYLDLGDIRTIPHLLHDKYLNEKTISDCREALYHDRNSKLPVSPLSILEDFAIRFFSEVEQSLITLGGDHSVSYPLVRSWIKAKRKQSKKVAIIHFDAHTDLLNTRLGIDICFGSWAYHCLELLEKPSHMIQLGIRSSGYDKQHWESSLGVSQFWAEEINNLGVTAIAEQIIKNLKADNIEELYLSFDIDSLDSKYASATGTPEPNGLSPQSAKAIIDLLAKEFKFHSADIVEVSPFLQTQDPTVSPEPESTLQSSKIIFETVLDIL